MNTEELKLIVELFSTITDGALAGGITYLFVHLVGELFPWVVGGIVTSKLLDRLPKIRKRSE